MTELLSGPPKDRKAKSRAVKRRTQPRRRKAMPDPWTVHTPLLSAAKQVALGSVPGAGKIYARTVAIIMGKHWESLTAVQREQLRVELEAEGYSGKESGRQQLIQFAVDGLTRLDHILERQSTTPVRPQVGQPKPPPTIPVSDLPKVIVQFDTASWPERGVLKLMGYAVGKSGLPADERRSILRQTYEVELVPSSAQVAAYLQGWGPPRSRQRLMAMRDSISRALRNAQSHRRADYSAAIADWEADLAWLTSTYRL
ncbi:hypothetical protein ABQE56_22220 [Mycolicibacterium elephantis]